MKKRDAAYWRGRLEREYPEIAAELDSGTIPSVRAAAIQAGLIRASTPLDELRRAWRKATAAEKEGFIAETGVAKTQPKAPARAVGKTAVPPPPSPPPPAPAPAPAPAPVAVETIPDLVRLIVMGVFPPGRNYGEDPEDVIREFVAEIATSVRDVVEYGAEWGDEDDLPPANKADIAAGIAKLKALLGEGADLAEDITGSDVAARIDKAGMSLKEAAYIAGMTQQALKAILAAREPLKAHARHVVEPILHEIALQQGEA